MIDVIGEGAGVNDGCECGIGIGMQGGFGNKWGDYDCDDLCSQCILAMGRAMTTGSAGGQDHRWQQSL